MKTYSIIILLAAGLATASAIDAAKRQVLSQIGDGQIQAPAATPAVTPAPAPGTTTIEATTLLTTTVCASSGTPAPAPPPPPPPPPSSPAPAPAPSASSVCPLTFTGDYQFPHLMVPVDTAFPSTGASTSYNGVISGSGKQTIVTFDIPASYAGKTCDTIFSLPAPGTMETSSYSLSGNGQLVFTEESGPAAQGMSASTLPGTKSSLGSWTPKQGGAYTVSSGACPAGLQVTLLISGTDSINFTYFQDYNPCPLGLYIVAK